MEKKMLNAGITDFKTFIENNYYFVDKSLFIEEVFSHGLVQLYTRPRKFGKSLNLSMLYYFLRNDADYSYLFEGLKVKEIPEIWKHQGKYPTIFISFRDFNFTTFEDTYKAIQNMMSDIYKSFENQLTDVIKNTYDARRFNEIKNCEGSYVALVSSLKTLTDLLREKYGHRAAVLVDEYDILMKQALIHGFYDKMSDFILSFLGSVMKDNPNLDLGVMTGLTRVPKPNIFSGFNNFVVYSILDKIAEDKFGFTEEEVKELLKYYEMEDHFEIIKEWYNGYNFNNNVIFNPWSVINYVVNKQVKNYWVNTTENNFLKESLQKSSRYSKVDLEKLLQGEIIHTIINDNIETKDIKHSYGDLYSFLVLGGYLAYKSIEFEGYAKCDLIIPNKEVKYIIENDIILAWFRLTDSISQRYEKIMANLIEGDFSIFTNDFPLLVEESYDYFDDRGRDPDIFYHSFVLGMIVSLNEKAEVKTNQDSGYGKYDVMVIPKDVNKRGLIFHFTEISEYRNKNLTEAIDKAKTLFIEKNYESEFLQRGIKDILKIAVVFEAKKVHIEIF